LNKCDYFIFGEQGMSRKKLQEWSISSLLSKREEKSSQSKKAMTSHAFDREIKETRTFLKIFFISLFVYLLFRFFIFDIDREQLNVINKFIGAYLPINHVLLFLITKVVLGISGWFLFYKCACLITCLLMGKNKFRFQLKMVLITPLVLSYYFIKDVEEFHMQGLFASYSSWFIIIPLLILFWVGRCLFNTEVFDGYFIKYYLGTSMVLFFLCWHSHIGGIWGDEDGYGYLDKELRAKYALTGQHAMKYLGMIASSYLGMYFGIMKTKWTDWNYRS